MRMGYKYSTTPSIFPSKSGRILLLLDGLFHPFKNSSRKLSAESLTSKIRPGIISKP